MAESGSTWADLQQWVKARLGWRTDLTQEIVDELTRAIEYYQDKIFLNQQAENSSWATCQTNVESVALPPNFNNVMFDLLVNIDGVWYPLEQKDQNYIEEYNAQVPPVIGPPVFYAIYSSDPGDGAYQPMINFAPVPDQNYQLKAIYQQVEPVPATDTTSNFWTVDAATMVGSRALGTLRSQVLRTQDGGAADFEHARSEYYRLQQRVADSAARKKVRSVYL